MALKNASTGDGMRIDTVSEDAGGSSGHQGNTAAGRHYPGAGILAGAIGGLTAGFFKLGWDVPFPTRPPDQIPETMVLVTMFTHVATPAWASFLIHFAFSILAGAIYGGLVEFFPVVAIGMGLGFGLALWVGAHEIVLPRMGLTPPTVMLPAGEQVSEFFGCAAWGFVIEVFRHDFRGRFVSASSHPPETKTIVVGTVKPSPPTQVAHG